jgi:hypothetical protein
VVGIVILPLKSPVLSPLGRLAASTGPDLLYSCWMLDTNILKPNCSTNKRHDLLDALIYRVLLVVALKIYCMYADKYVACWHACVSSSELKVSRIQNPCRLPLSLRPSFPFQFQLRLVSLPLVSPRSLSLGMRRWVASLCPLCSPNSRQHE